MTRGLSTGLLSLAGVVVLSSCIVEAPGADRSNVERRQAVVAAAPPSSTQVRANLGGKVELTAATVTPGRVRRGESFQVAAFFKVLEELAVDYTVFVHIEDAEGRMDRLNADHRPVGGRYPTTDWKKGETIRDEFIVTLPPGATARALNIFVGLWDPLTDTRVSVANPNETRHDGRDRVLLAQVPVE